MSVTLYLRSENCGIATGAKWMSQNRGTASTAYVTTAPANGGPVQVTASAGGTALSWWYKVNAFTLSGNISASFRGKESATSVNACAGIRVDRYTSAGVFVSTVLSERSIPSTATTSEYTTTDAAKALAAVAPTSTTFADGDYIVVTMYIGNTTQSLGAGTVTNTVSGPTSAAAGDSFVTFVDNIPVYSPGASVPTYITAFTDSYPGSSYDTTKWLLEGTSAPTQGSGQMNLITNSSYSEVVSKTSFDLTGKATITQVKAFPVYTGTGISYWDVQNSTTGGGSSQYGWSWDQVGFVEAYAGNGATTVCESSNAAVAGTNNWWRIFELLGAIFFDYSTDGVTFINVGCIPAVTAVTTLYIEQGAGTNSGTATGAFSVANCNLPPTSSTPITSTDSATLSESSSIVQQHASADSATLSESSSVSTGTTSVSDSDGFFFSDNPTDIKIIDATVPDAVLSESSSLASSIATTDTATLNEADSIAGTYSRTDSATLSESSAIVQFLAVTSTDAGTLAETDSIAGSSASVDSGSLTEVSALAGTSATTDTGHLAESSALVITDFITSTDSGALAETDALVNTDASSDSATTTESSAVSVSIGSTDTGHLAESSSLVINQSVGSVDGAALTDSSAIAAGLSSTDSASMAESADGIVFESDDSFHINDRTSNIVISDSVPEAVLSESSSLVVGTATTDTGTLSEVSAISVITSSTDSAVLDETSSKLITGQNPESDDLFSVDESSSISVTVASTDGFTLSDSSAIGEFESDVDSAALTESSAVVVSISSTDAFHGSEISGIATTLSSTDSATSTDSSAVVVTGQNPASSDTATLTEVSAIVATFASTDSLHVADSSGISAALAGADTGEVSETSDVGITGQSPTASDHGSLSESVSIVVIIASSDSITTSDSSGPSASVASTDSATATDTSLAAPHVASTDSAHMTESVMISVSVVSLDAMAVSEALHTLATLASSDVAQLSESQIIAVNGVNVLSTDHAVLSELSHVLIIPAIPILSMTGHVEPDRFSGYVESDRLTGRVESDRFTGWVEE